MFEQKSLDKIDGDYFNIIKIKQHSGFKILQKRGECAGYHVSKYLKRYLMGK